MFENCFKTVLNMFTNCLKYGLNNYLKTVFGTG